MHTRIDIIDGQEVVVKVYTPRPLPKKCTAKGKGRRSNWKAKAKRAKELAEHDKFNQLCRQIAKDNRERARTEREPDLG